MHYTGSHLSYVCLLGCHGFKSAVKNNSVSCFLVHSKHVTCVIPWLTRSLCVLVAKKFEEIQGSAKSGGKKEKAHPEKAPKKEKAHQEKPHAAEKPKVS